uniref:Uncharacterized protein n=1 Tax=Steinernema glaseri TaxID=37863 RepID=A0A1I7ZE51_9BILA
MFLARSADLEVYNSVVRTSTKKIKTPRRSVTIVRIRCRASSCTPAKGPHTPFVLMHNFCLAQGTAQKRADRLNEVVRDRSLQRTAADGPHTSAGKVRTFAFVLECSLALRTNICLVFSFIL